MSLSEWRKNGTLIAEEFEKYGNIMLKMVRTNKDGMQSDQSAGRFVSFAVVRHCVFICKQLEHDLNS